MSGYFDDFIARINALNRVADRFVESVRDDADYDEAFANKLWQDC